MSESQNQFQEYHTTFPDTPLSLDADEELLRLLRPEIVSQPSTLEGLFNLMSKAQKLIFKKAVVKQTIYYITKKLPPPEQDEGERLFIELAKEWLRNPTKEVADKAKLAAITDCIDRGVRYFNYPAFFLEPACAAGAKTGLDAAEIALKIAGIGYVGVGIQWQITVAWAILYDQKLPDVGEESVLKTATPPKAKIINN
ncbi:hypothetical protein BCD67_01775 [Oscillatoriales cyanobacterium USR001]|nr:hypothetical protein BCD67_01775 [Oscillatoriales cyanobacterium USR001]